MKVAVVTMYYPPDRNGIATYADFLVEGLRQAGIEVLVITRQRPRQKRPELIKQVSVPRVDLHSWRGREIMRDGRKYCLKFAKGAEKILKSELDDLDMVNFITTWDDYIMADVGLRLRANKKKPRLIVISGGGGKRAPQRMDKIRSKILNQVDKITVMSHNIEDLLRRAGVAKRLFRYVPHGVDLEQFNPSRRRRSRRSKTIEVLFTGRIDKIKGLFDVVEAARQLRNRPFRFRFIGDAPFPEQRIALKKKIKDYGLENVSLESGVPNNQVARLMANADIFIYPSHDEWGGIAALEAIASGLPAVVSNEGALPEMVRDGKNGFVIKPKDVAGIIRSLKKMESAEVRRRFGRASRQRSRQYSLDRFIKNYLQIYGRGK